MKELIEAFIIDKFKCKPPVEMSRVDTFVNVNGEQCYEAIHEGYSCYDTVVTCSELLEFMWSRINDSI